MTTHDPRDESLEQPSPLKSPPSLTSNGVKPITTTDPVTVETLAQELWQVWWNESPSEEFGNHQEDWCAVAHYILTREQAQAERILELEQKVVNLKICLGAVRVPPIAISRMKQEALRKLLVINNEMIDEALPTLT